MAFIKFKRTRVMSSEPSISINDGRFQYGSMISKVANLADKNFVIYHVDEVNRIIGFEFLKDTDDIDAYTLSSSSGKKNSHRSAAQELINSYSWVDAVAKLSDNDAKSFKAIYNSGLWKIRFRPSFEEEVKIHDAEDIDRSATGIYRYLKSNSNEIVYIGKGNIYNRLKEKSRRDWIFDKVQYSEVADEDDQFQWEHYWINQFKRNNKGKLPVYNRQSGNKPK